MAAPGKLLPSLPAFSEKVDRPSMSFCNIEAVSVSLREKLRWEERCTFPGFLRDDSVRAQLP